MKGSNQIFFNLPQSQELTRVNPDRNTFSINLLCLLSRGFIHHNHRILNQTKCNQLFSVFVKKKLKNRTLQFCLISLTKNIFKKTKFKPLVLSCRLTAEAQVEHYVHYDEDNGFLKILD